MKDLKDAGHLFRLAAVFSAMFLIFLVVRGALVPKSFGRYGHYRGDALAEIAAKPIAYAGHQACENCHGDVVEVKTKGKHKGVNLRVLPRAAGKACRRSGLGPAGKAGDHLALSTLPHGQRRQAEDIPAGGSGRPLRRSGLR